MNRAQEWRQEMGWPQRRRNGNFLTISSSLGIYLPHYKTNALLTTLVINEDKSYESPQSIKPQTGHTTERL